MSFNAEIFKEVVLVLWESPESGDLKKIQGIVEDAQKENGGPVVYISVVSPSQKPLDEATRKEMNDSLEDLLAHCRSAHLVLEGSGMRLATKRLIAAGFLLVKSGGKMHVNESVENALLDAKMPPVEIQKILAQIKH